MRRIIVKTRAEAERSRSSDAQRRARTCAAAGDVDSRAHGGRVRRDRADGHLAGAHRQHDLPRRRDARVRRAARLARRTRRGADQPQRQRRRRVRLEGLGGQARMGRQGRAADARVRADGRGADLDLRAVSDAHAPGLRPADRVGRIERDQLRELGDRRPHRALSRSAGHLLRDHRPRAGGRPASDRESRAASMLSAPRRRAGRRCSRTISSSPCSATWSGSSPAITSPSSTASSCRRPRISSRRLPRPLRRPAASRCFTWSASRRKRRRSRRRFSGRAPSAHGRRSPSRICAPPAVS